MKPITYWIQNDAIDELVEICGAHLEKLSASTRRGLIVCLAIDLHPRERAKRRHRRSLDAARESDPP
jgi:hypothetical protein